MRRNTAPGKLANLINFVAEHWKRLALLILIVFAGFQMNQYRSESASLRDQVGASKADLAAIVGDNQKLKNDVEYLKNPYNVLKEVRSQFNYKRATERLIVIIPQRATTTATTTKP